MTPEEVVDLLTLIAARDRRTVGKVDVAVWIEDAGDLPFNDARAAVARHYRESTDWLMPAHVRRLVKAIRDKRLAAAPEPAPPADPADEEAYRRALAGIRNRIGDGRPPPFRAIEGGRGTGPSEAFKAARSAEDRDRVLAQTVPCPVEWCRALAGEPCTVEATGQPMAVGHPARLDAARQAQAP